MRILSIALIHFLALNIMSGSCVAGIDAGKVFNDWPFYNGEIVPAKIYNSIPFWKNFFENKGMVQFNHRNFAYLTFWTSLYIFLKSRRLNILK